MTLVRRQPIAALVLLSWAVAAPATATGYREKWRWTAGLHGGVVVDMDADGRQEIIGVALHGLAADLMTWGVSSIRGSRLGQRWVSLPTPERLALLTLQ